MRQGFLQLPFQDKLSSPVDCCGDLTENCQGLSWSAPTCGSYGPMARCTEPPSPVKLTPSLLMLRLSGFVCYPEFRRRWKSDKTLHHKLFGYTHLKVSSMQSKSTGIIYWTFGGSTILFSAPPWIIRWTISKRFSKKNASHWPHISLWRWYVPGCSPECSWWCRPMMTDLRAPLPLWERTES